jgi:hypothetical protein
MRMHLNRPGIHQTDINRIVAAANALGLQPSEYRASTGTTYIHCYRPWNLDESGEQREFCVRISTHMECYPPPADVEQVSVSPLELTVTQAIAKMERFAGMSLSVARSWSRHAACLDKKSRR